METNISTMGKAALDIAKAGFPVFPCREKNLIIGGKELYKVKAPYTTTGFKEATTDEAKIIAWWKSYPNALIGMPTGSRSGISALDLDVDATKGKDGVNEWEKLCKAKGIEPYTTKTNKTPRGGKHLLFKHKEGFKTSTDKIANGIDTRGEGGYIILPPSSIDGKSYESANDLPLGDIPYFIMDIIAPKEQEQQKTEPKKPQQEQKSNITEEDDIRAALDSIPSDYSYLDWVQMGQALHSWNAIAGFPIWNAWSSKGSKYKEGECSSKWKSFKSEKGINLATLFGKAKEYGYSSKKGAEWYGKAQQKEVAKNATEEKELTKDEAVKHLRQDVTEKILYPAQDYHDNTIYFGVKIKNEPYLLTSKREIISFKNAESSGIYLKNPFLDKSRISRSAIADYLEEKREINIPELYQRIHSYISRFVIFQDQQSLIFLVLWIMGTYIYMIFRYFPYVWLTAEKASGKTTLMEVICEIAFNGDLMNNPTEAVIFRDIENNQPSMLIDEVENLSKRDKEAYGALISILNSGFNQAGKVKRAERSGKGNFTIKNYSSYSPKMFAGIKDIDDVLQDRTVKVRLIRKKDSENAKRYKTRPEVLELQKMIRDDLYLFALTFGSELAEAYFSDISENLPGFDHLNNRELDIWEPILTIAMLIDTLNKNHVICDQLIEFSKAAAKEKQADSVSANETYKLLTLLKEMIEEKEVIQLKEKDGIQYFSAKAVFEYFQNTDEYDWLQSKNKLSNLLKKVEITSIQERIHLKRERLYLISKQTFADYCERFKI